MRCFLFATVCLWVGVACADAQTEVMSDKLDRLEAEMALMQKKIYQVPEATDGKVPNNLDDLYSQIDEQNTLIQDLTRKVEDLSHQITENETKMKQLSQDVNFRFQELKNTPNTPTQTDNTDNSEQKAYDSAYEKLKAGEYPQAESAFLDFMKTYPNSKLLGNANYWLGETYYVREQYEQAVGFFADGFTKYRDNIKAPDSMFKLGLSFKALKKDTEACSAFLGLSDEFPKADETIKTRAKQEAQDLKCP